MNVSQMGHIGQVYGVYEGEAGVEAAAPAARSRQNRKAQVKAKQGQRKQQQASKRKLNESDEEGEYPGARRRPLYHTQARRRRSE